MFILVAGGDRRWPASAGTSVAANFGMSITSTPRLPLEVAGHIATFLPVTDGVSRLCTVFVNCYAVDLDDGGWVLVDTGLPGSWWYVLAAVRRKYGTGARPRAIVLTHGHFDHAGNAKRLAEMWDVPIYASRREMPYLTGRSDYPPQDPTPGGAISQMSRAFPTGSMNLGSHLREMPASGDAPEMPGWKIIATPGHTAGHVSLFRESDRVLLAGDAFVTTDLDAWSSQMTWPRELSRPPTPLTPDWKSARESIFKLAELEPTVASTGHGLPIRGAELPDNIRAGQCHARAGWKPILGCAGGLRRRWRCRRTAAGRARSGRETTGDRSIGGRRYRGSVCRFAVKHHRAIREKRSTPPGQSVPAPPRLSILVSTVPGPITPSLRCHGNFVPSWQPPDRSW